MFDRGTRASIEINMTKDTLTEIHENLQKLQQDGFDRASKGLTAAPITSRKKIVRPKKLPAHYEAFKMWLSLPAQFIGKTPKELNELGITNPHLIELCQIKTQGSFVEAYKVNKNTLSEWRKELEHDPEVLKSYQSFGQLLTKNLMTALYENALKHGDAERIKAWMTFVEGWSPRETIIQTTTQFDVVGFIREVERQKAKERESNNTKKGHE